MAAEGVDAPVDEPSEAGDGVSARQAAGAFIAVAAVLAVWVWFSHRFFGVSLRDIPVRGWPGRSWLAGWAHWDAGWYRSIAVHGYHYVPGRQSNVAFVPGYPLAMRALRPVFGNAVTAGIAITFASGLAATVIYAGWCRRWLTPSAQRSAVALLLVYPYSWFLFGAVYADALFLVATVAAFALLESNRPVAAGLAGFVASATRPVGPAVVIGLVIRQLERRDALRYRLVGGRWRVPTGIDWHRLRPVDSAVALSAGGFVAYATYLQARWGDPFLFNSVQRYWDQSTGPRTWFKVHLGGIIVHDPGNEALYILGCLLQGALALGALAMTPRIVRRFGWGYGALVALSLAVPVIGSKDFQGLGRYLLAAFPVFALAGEWLARRSPRLRRWVLAVSGGLLLAWVHAYARGRYVA
jgi:hypothetical protein